MSTAPPQPTQPRPQRAASTQHATGRLEISRVAGRSAITRCRAGSPLKLLTPRREGSAAWVYVSSFGGGLVAGDDISLDIDIKPGAVCILSTQASTKVYHRQGDLGARQRMRAAVGAGGLLVVAPDPLTCFRHAVYEQHQRFDLAADSSLVLLDWYTCGRRAMGERWAFDRLATTNEIYIDSKLVACDRSVLDAADGPVDDAHRVGRFDCFATLMLTGPACADAAKQIERDIAGMPLDGRDRVWLSASRLPWGLVVRVAGERTQDVAAAVYQRLTWLEALAGSRIDERKW